MPNPLLFRTLLCCATTCAALHAAAQVPALNGDSLYAIWNDASRPDTVRFVALQKRARHFFYGGDPDSFGPLTVSPEKVKPLMQAIESRYPARA